MFDTPLNRRHIALMAWSLTCVASALVEAASFRADAGSVRHVGTAAEYVPIAARLRDVKPVVDSPMFTDPELIVPDPRIVFSPQLKTLWLKAIARPEADLQRQAADAVSRAQRMGMKRLADCVPALVEVLDSPDSHPVARLAAARALAILDARQTAPSLFKHLAAESLAFAQIAEPALARWDYRPMRKVWIDRLPVRDTRRGLLSLAIRSLAVVNETGAAPKLEELAADSSAAPQMRLEAARALGRLRSSGLYDRAFALAADKSSRHLIDRLVAAHLLRRHTGDPVQALLRELALDSEPSVSAVALERLLSIDPLLILPIVDRLLPRRDANVRVLAAAVLAAHPVASSIKTLGPLLNDPHPGNRAFVRESLRRFTSKPKLDPLVRAEAMRVLQLDDWRGQEQSALLLGQLDHKPAAKRLIVLLDSRRPEVMLATAWALRKLAIPQTLPAMLAKATRETVGRRRAGGKGKKGGGQPPDGTNEQVVQLFQAFGQMKYAPAAPLLRQCVPKAAPFHLDQRTAAVWSLGFIDHGRGKAELASQLAGRLADAFGMFPEFEPVRRMSAVSLGRLKAKEQLATLRRFYKNDGPETAVGLGCRWAIREITGETLPGPTIRKSFQTRWFLIPLEEPKASK